MATKRKYSEETVREIAEWLHKGRTSEEICEHFMMRADVLSKVRNGTLARVEGLEYPLPKPSKAEKIRKRKKLDWGEGTASANVSSAEDAEEWDVWRYAFEREKTEYEILRKNHNTIAQYVKGMLPMKPFPLMWQDFMVPTGCYETIAERRHYIELLWRDEEVRDVRFN